MKKYRVHICPVGFEEERIWKPLNDPKADKVWLITKAGKDLSAPFIKKIAEQLDKNGIKHEVVNCDILDLTDALRLFREIFQKEKENEVFVNVSSGTKVMAIAGMMACMMWEGTPYYVIPEGHNEIKKPITFGMKDIKYLPHYKIDNPPEDVLECVRFVATKGNNGANKKSIITHLKKTGFLHIDLPERKKEPSIQSEYRSLEERILRPSRDEWKYVYEEGRGKGKRIKLTKEGENAIIVFGRQIKAT